MSHAFEAACELAVFLDLVHVADTQDLCFVATAGCAAQTLPTSQWELVSLPNVDLAVSVPQHP